MRLTVRTGQKMAMQTILPLMALHPPQVTTVDITNITLGIQSITLDMEVMSTITMGSKYLLFSKTLLPFEEFIRDEIVQVIENWPTDAERVPYTEDHMSSQ